MVAVPGLQQMVAQLRTMISSFDASGLPGAEASAAVKLFTEAEHLCQTGRGIAARRVEETGRWREEGSKNANSWMASASGTTENSARMSLETARKAQQLPDVDAALRAGRLSSQQASLVAKGATADPSAQYELLKAAERDSLRELHARANRIEAAAQTEEREKYEDVHAQRSLRHWTKNDKFTLVFENTPDAGAIVLAGLAPFHEQIYKKARKDKRSESPEAYESDALVAMAEEGGSSSSTVVNIDVDYDTFMKGDTQTGERWRYPELVLFRHHGHERWRKTRT